MQKSSLKKNIFPLLLCLVGFPQISETIYGPILPSLSQGLAISEAQSQLTLSFYFIGFAIGVLYWGLRADRLGRRSSMLQGLLYYFVGSLFCLLSPSLDLLLVSRMIQAFGASVGSVITMTILRDLYQDQDRHRVFSILGTAISCTPAIGQVLGGVIDEYAGYKGVFYGLCTLAIVMWLWAFLYLPETKPAQLLEQKPPRPWPLFLKMLTDTKVLTFSFIIGAGNAMLFGFFGESPFIFKNIFNINPAHYGIAGIFVAIAGIIGSQYSRYLLKKQVNALNIIKKGINIAVIFSLIYALYMNSPYYHIGFFILIIMPLLGALGMIMPNCLSIGLESYQKSLGAAGAFFGLMYYSVLSIMMFLLTLLPENPHTKLAIYFVGLSLAVKLAAFKIQNK